MRNAPALQPAPSFAPAQQRWQRAPLPRPCCSRALWRQRRGDLVPPPCLLAAGSIARRRRQHAALLHQHRGHRVLREMRGSCGALLRPVHDGAAVRELVRGGGLHAVTLGLPVPPRPPVRRRSLRRLPPRRVPEGLVGGAALRPSRPAQRLPLRVAALHRRALRGPGHERGVLGRLPRRPRPGLQAGMVLPPLRLRPAAAGRPHLLRRAPQRVHTRPPLQPLEQSAAMHSRALIAHRRARQRQAALHHRARRLAHGRVRSLAGRRHQWRRLQVERRLRPCRRLLR
mmetsp:Transcript_27287/g.55164  ORF Transcript_27287/g.55164 Transcript_27287/m.55164 type:complete len:285 (-) Transcript_27287:422-1276(-)